MVFLRVNGEIFYIHKIFMKISGVWPLDGCNYASQIIFSVMSMLELTLVITFLVDCRGESTINCASNISFLTIALVSRISLRAHGRSMISLIESTIDDWSTTIDLAERDIMDRHNKLGTLLYTFFDIYFTGIESIEQIVILSSFRKLVRLLQQRTTINDAFTWNDVIQALPTTVMIFSNVMVYSGVLLFWTIAMHLASQLKILKNRFINFLAITEKNARRRELRRLVDRHNRLLDLVKDLDGAFNFFLALRIVNIQLSDCERAYQLAVAMRTDSFARSAFQLSYFVTSLCALSTYYYAGQYLTSCCEEIGDVLTECNWCDLSADSITTYSIIIMRSRMSKTVTIGGIFRLNHSNYKYIVKTLYSYISVIVTVT